MAVMIGGVTPRSLFTAYASLLLTSEPLAPDERLCDGSDPRLDQAGSRRGVGHLRRVASFRAPKLVEPLRSATLPHTPRQLPVRRRTVYPNLLHVPRGRGRARPILLHESYHLFGRRRDVRFCIGCGWPGSTRMDVAALRNTRVWKTRANGRWRRIPSLFTCRRR